MTAAPRVPDLLVKHREPLRTYLRQKAAGLLRFESLEDLCQGVHLRALKEAEHFEYRGVRAFFAWLYTLARRHIAERHAHWSALKRGSGKVLRLTLSGSRTGAILIDDARGATAAGPATFAARRELLVLAAKALATLPERDRSFLRWTAEGIPIKEQARRFAISYAAAQRSGLRAVERFRMAFQLLTGMNRRDA